MKSYVDLMKENIIDFGNLILEKYYLLNLNEKQKQSMEMQVM